MAYVRSLAAIALAAVLLAATFSSSTHTTAQDTVSFATPPFVVAGKRFAFTWPGGGPPQTYTVKQVRPDGWILVEVADEVVNTDLLVPGERPVRWLNVGAALSIQEMRPHLY
jgi:hypothetical protein